MGYFTIRIYIEEENGNVLITREREKEDSL